MILKQTHFFFKSPFCTFSCINSGFGRPAHVMKKISNCHFHNASKECFWPKKNSDFMHGFKSAILAIFQLYAGKSTKRVFSKKALAGIEK
jgi:hypothetical protein